MKIIKRTGWVLIMALLIISSSLFAVKISDYDYKAENIDLRIEEQNLKTTKNESLEKAIKLNSSTQKGITIVMSATPEVYASQPNLNNNPKFAKYDDLVIYVRDANNHQLSLNPSNFEVDFDTSSDFNFHGVFGDVLYMSCNAASPYLNLSFDARIKDASGWGPWKNFTYFFQGYP
ncbi:hypothetical protein [Flavivirga eckloniae]|uniref:Uncharacterized protein n=1 Tax=Flavivirga eckloniae TaxID=1803846 RepID=A0A2K9PPY3_9FLAO|nr:hypothetical protein [Flavivirga eckloniae]AUP78888.1 hypothetical protein C1H87_09310 [Flavivirga eckloniae]